ncbi:MAG: hypothetical protein CSA66_08145 [Proteobacteria bacterium]|nr:MAG: hypothetical protein CSA66_08145 [Pseudomonadota bacterium]
MNSDPPRSEGPRREEVPARDAPPRVGATWLVAHDFTAAADAAMMIAASDASRLGVRLVLFHAYRLPPVAGGLEALANARGLASWNRISEKVAARASEEIGAVAERLARRLPELDVTTRVAEGNPVSAVLAAAEDEVASRIVVGYSPTAGLRRRIKGSVSEQIVKQAPIPVLLVKS